MGQEEMIEAIIVALLSDGHILLEGYPGLGKTITVKTVARVLDAKFQRVQFTPDLIPGDITGFDLKCGTRNQGKSGYKKGLYLPICYLQMKLTAHLQRFKALFSSDAGKTSNHWPGDLSFREIISRTGDSKSH